MSTRTRARTLLLSTMAVAMLTGPAPAAFAIELTPGGLFGLLGTKDGSTDSDANTTESAGLTGFTGIAGSPEELLSSLG